MHDAPGFRDWAGAGPEREKLVQVWRELVGSRDGLRSGCRTDINTDVGGADNPGGEPKEPPPDRLMTLLKQAAAFQVLSARTRTTKRPWTVES